ncbi:hypothetical protein ACET3X_009550 [Alternaria dauci]|uniref:Uncharacterized protein n=1 Tax=Alternaria dauci TaxID=48095 RepID=A0ABR3U6F3_9PLEO
MDTPPPTNTTAMPSKPEILQQEHTHPDPKTSIRNRLKHFTLAWFLSTMSTGGLALALADTPHQFPGLYYIGLTLFFANILLFLILCTCTFLRAIYHPTHFTASFSHPQESLSLGAFWLSLSVILAGIQTYGLTHNPSLSSSSASSAAAAGYPWLVDTVYVSYYIYAASSLVNSIFQYWILIAYSKSRPVPYLPAIFLAGYSAMLTGTLASMIVHTQPGHRVMGIVVSGVAYQGFGWCVSFVAIVA